MFAQLHFESPQWVHSLWLALLVSGLLVWLELRRRQVLDRFLAFTMQSRLARQLTPLRRFLALGLFAAALVLMVVSLMRPQFGLTYRTVPQVGAQIMICLDVSRSMLAEDAKPNRLERAKAEITDMLNLLDGEQVGLTAFAGSASVICPMTSDFGFLNLVLKTTGANSVGMGGTRLEEPIRKAMDGFGEAADISRVIMLITDGEDLDSFPLDAAKEAAERGIKIITIGFGDETGTQIPITDARTGATQVVLDETGQPVVSRLDGELLRQIALETDGAYVPAGTGSLDLESIYQQHIVPLMRGSLPSGQQPVRNEAFAVPLGLALLLLLLSIAIGSGLALPLPRPDTVVASIVMLTLCLFVTTDKTWAQAVEPDSSSTSQNDTANSDDTANDDAQQTAPDSNQDKQDSSPVLQDQIDAIQNPREVYNTGLALMDQDLDQATAYLTAARAKAGTDGEVRYRSAYNLGWVDIKHADRLLASEPQQALEHLQLAAGWFRKAIQLRPENEEARHNLEITLRRILELTDSLRAKEDRDLAQRLDQAIAAERQLLSQSGSLVERLSAPDTDPDADEFRRDFRQLAVDQRQILSDAQAILDTADQEHVELTKAKPDELSPEQQLRLAQLSMLMPRLEQAVQRLGQARTQYRLRQPQRGFRRSSRGLSELKRARDAFREPQEMISMLLADGKELAGQTNQYFRSQNLSGLGANQNSAPLPAWLTAEWLHESSESQAERTAELAALLQQVFQIPPTDEQLSQMSGAERRAYERSKDAPPLVQTAADAFQAATESAKAVDWSTALQQQVDGIQALAAALEKFADLKSLIELAYGDQQQLQQVMQQLSQLDPAEIAGSSPALSERQQKNLQRLETIADEIQGQLADLAAAEPQGPLPPGQSANTPPTDEATQQRQAEQQRYEIAKQLADQIRQDMQQTDSAIQKLEVDNPAETTDGGIDAEDSANRDNSKQDNASPATDEGEDAANQESRSPLQPAMQHGDMAVQNLQQLRRLFYSIVEHLQDTAQRQADLNDETQNLVAEEDEASKANSLLQQQLQQESLSQLAEQIKQGLNEQAEMNPTPDPNSDATGSDQAAQQQQAMSQAYREAAVLVGQATSEMDSASQAMQQLQQQWQSADADATTTQANEPAADDALETDSTQEEGNAGLQSVRNYQDQSLQRLLEALALLQPPHDNNQNQGQQDQQNQDQEQQSQDEQQQQQQNRGGMNQLLQMVRDREAARREAKDEKAQQGRAPSLRDW